MLKLTKTEQAFRQGYEELFQLSYQTVNLMVADSTELAEIGIDQSEIDSLKNLSDQFKERDFDEYLLLEQKMATQAKNELADELRLLLYKLETKLKLAYGTKNVKYQMFDLQNVSSLDDSELAKKASMCAYLTKGKFSEALNFNLDEIQVDLLKEKGDALRRLVDLQEVASNERHVAAQLRVTEANALYKAVSRIRTAGKKYWSPIDYSRSQAYKMPTLTPSTADDSPPESEAETFVMEETNFVND